MSSDEWKPDTKYILLDLKDYRYRVVTMIPKNIERSKKVFIEYETELHHYERKFGMMYDINVKLMNE